MPDPLPVLPLDYAKPSTNQRRVNWLRVCRICLPLGWLCAAIALILIVWADVESVLITGPILLSVGILILIASQLTGNGYGLLAGIGHCAICILFVGLVNAFHWSPNRAKEPFQLMGMAYVFVAIVPTGIATHKAWRA